MQHNMNRIYKTCLTIISCFLLATGNAQQSRKIISFDADWKFIKDDIRQELKNETEQEKQSREELIKKNKQVEQERSKAFNTYIDEQLNELLKSGKLSIIIFLISSSVIDIFDFVAIAFRYLRYIV